MFSDSMYADSNLTFIKSYSISSAFSLYILNLAFPIFGEQLLPNMFYFLSCKYPEGSERRRYVKLKR